MNKVWWRFYRYEKASLMVDSYPLGLSVIDTKTQVRYFYCLGLGLYWRKS